VGSIGRRGAHADSKDLAKSAGARVLPSAQKEAEYVSLREAGLGMKPVAATIANLAKHSRPPAPSDEPVVANSIARRRVVVHMTDGVRQLLRGLLASSVVPVEDFRLALPRGFAKALDEVEQSTRSGRARERD
jgi:hypothetical protein